MQLLGCAPIHQLPIDTSTPHRETPDKDILGDRQIKQESHFLMDETNSRRQRVGRRIGRIVLSPPGHGSVRRSNESGNDRRDRGLAGAIFAEQRDRFARSNVQVDIAYDGDRTIFLADTMQGESAPAEVCAVMRSCHCSDPRDKRAARKGAPPNSVGVTDAAR